MLRNLLKLVLSFFFMISGVSAQKLSVGTGVYSINAKVQNRKTNIANLGAYRFQYHASATSNFEFTLGYSVFIESIVTGDKAFGPDIGFNYFPFGTKTISKGNLDRFSINSKKKFNPFLSLKFSQRQYQSINTAYSGFSIGGGCEFGFFENFSPYIDLNYGFLEGPQSGSLSELSSTVGISFSY